MAKKNMVVCDACGKEQNAEAPEGPRWYQVATAVSPEEYQKVLAMLQQGAKVKDLVEQGDFCSLMCVANWASALHEMKALNAE